LAVAADIRDYLDEVADALQPGSPRRTIILAGGSLLAWYGLRDTTADVDSIRPLTPNCAAPQRT